MKLRDKKQKESVKETLRQGESGEFWSILCQAMDETIELLERDLNSPDLNDYPAEEYKIQSEILKSNIKYLKKLKESPRNITVSLEEPDQSEPNPDPYDD